MKRQIRQGVFETNSSSTHAICIATDTKYNIPEKVSFCFDDFGWEINKLTSRQDRANYLYTLLLGYDNIDEIRNKLQHIVDVLKNNGVERFNFDDFKVCVYTHNGEVNTYIEGDGYIDHAYCARDFLDKVLSDDRLLLDYLFSDKSFILTGNDNDDYDVDIKVDYPHEEFYKGN